MITHYILHAYTHLQRYSTLKQNYSQICTFFRPVLFKKKKNKQTRICSECKIFEYKREFIQIMIIRRFVYERKYKENLINGWLTTYFFFVFCFEYAAHFILNRFFFRLEFLCKSTHRVKYEYDESEIMMKKGRKLVNYR